MAFQKQGDVEKHEVVTPDDNAKLNHIRQSSAVRLDDLERLDTDYDAVIAKDDED